MSRPLCITGADIVTPFRVIHDGVIVMDGSAIDHVGRKDLVPLPQPCERIHLPGRSILPLAPKHVVLTPEGLALPAQLTAFAQERLAL